MPYLEPGPVRTNIDAAAGELAAVIDIEHQGEVNRAVCALYCALAPRRYGDKARVLADIMLACHEIYRRDIGPYENEKAKINGDLDWPTLGTGG